MVSGVALGDIEACECKVESAENRIGFERLMCLVG